MVNRLNISDIYFEKLGVGNIQFGRYGTSYVNNCTFKDHTPGSRYVSMFVTRNKLIVTNCNFINISGSIFVKSLNTNTVKENITMNYCNFINVTYIDWFQPRNNNF